ncbi:MAG: hypothetical protein K8S13_01865 [Desulfobacula sp.]|uniref:hypothetical protein n=1 Tax=Desulfobacula sp. TaxID=2593537 RepID=UPI0025C72690|nr:hypothetical protein [Desulfobacula sp.]MCD4718593.1 hypothetical protein [Desulfobacula sp.]
MRKIFGSLLIILFIACNNLYAEDVTTVEAKDTDISDNLDLEAVASIFGEAKDLEEFEKKLNDPDTQISNLDLNEDGEVDYLRVTETSKGDTHLVTIQAVIGKDQYQDVATIDVEKKGKDETQVQVVGDVYMYGPGYIVEPVYVHPPVIFVFFWSPLYHPWRSPFYWGYYPPYYRPWRPYPRHRHRTNVNVNINVNNSYNYTSVRKSKTSIELQKKSRRNDFGAKNPDKSFAKRNEGVKNKQALNQKRDVPKKNKPKANDVKKPTTNKSKATTGKQVQKDWKPASEKAGAASKVKDGRVSVPSRKINSKPSHRKSSKSVKPSSRKTKQQIGRPSSRKRPKRR